MNDLVLLKPYGAISEGSNRLGLLLDMVLRQYVGIHEYVKDNTPCHDRVQAHHFKQDLPAKVTRLRESIENNTLGLEAKVKYESDGKKTKPHRRNLWIKDIEIGDYGEGPFKLCFDYFNRPGINIAIRKNIDWAYLEIAFAGHDVAYNFTGRHTILPEWFYKFVIKRPIQEPATGSQELQIYNNALAIRDKLVIENAGLENVRVIRPKDKHPSGLEPNIYVDTCHGKAKLTHIFIPINLASYKNQ